MKTTLIVTYALLAALSPALAQQVDPRYPGSTNRLTVDEQRLAAYARAARSVGLELSRLYSWSEWVDLQRAKRMGVAGQYEWLAFSTGGGDDANAMVSLAKRSCGWELMYYRNHDLSIIYEICRVLDLDRSFVRVLKASKGRRPRLNSE